MQNKLVYNSFNKDPFHTHFKLLQKINSGSRVLEIGSATGYFTKMLIKKGCEVTAIEKDTRAFLISKKIKGARFLNIDVFDIKNHIKTEKFDYILCADILEHTPDPLKVLTILKDYITSNGQIIVSVPNIANFSIRMMILRGDFKYSEYGIMDKTHLHFFTKSSIEELFHKLSFRIKDFDVVSGFETSRLYQHTIGPIVFRVHVLRRFEYFITRMFPGLLSLEFIYVVKKN